MPELFGSVRPVGEVPATPVHPRILVRPTDGGIELGLVVWEDPGGAEALHHALRPLVEGALLSELSRPRAEARPPSLRLVSFVDIERIDDALRAFGLVRSPAGPAWRDTVAHVRGEASVVGREVPDEPAALFEATFVTTEVATSVEGMVEAILEDAPFGARPGQLFAALTDALEAAGQGNLAPDLDTLDTLERLLVPTGEGAVRWVPPRCFQGLCDAVALVATRDRGLEVAWAESEPDETGSVPPPLVRVGGTTHVPLGEELLRWLVMPLMPGEQVPPLRAWLLDRIG